jgi:hypothetical protein
MRQWGISLSHLDSFMFRQVRLPSPFPDPLPVPAFLGWLQFSAAFSHRAVGGSR